jgi:hypothetical protein
VREVHPLAGDVREHGTEGAWAIVEFEEQRDPTAILLLLHGVDRGIE